jgi:dihydropteroate synthase
VRLRLRESVLELEPGRPALMGIVNATPDSFSDRQGAKGLDELEQRAHALVGEGAQIIDVGGESGRTDRQAVSEEEEIARIVPLVQRLSAAEVPVSVDTWREGPAQAALEAGAAMINDVSGLAQPALAALCAQTGAALVITHTRVPPKTKGFPAYEDVVADVLALLGDRSGQAREAGVADDQLLLDPGFDLGKQTGESVEILRRLPELESLGRPLLMAISRKDFVGSITSRRPADRDAGTLGAIEPALTLGVGSVLRVHDVAGASDFLAVRRHLLDDGLVAAPLDEGLRREITSA